MINFGIMYRVYVYVAYDLPVLKEQFKTHTSMYYLNS